MTRQLTFSANEFYHLYNRGTEKRLIFTKPGDYGRFLALLHVCNQRKRIEVNLRGPTSEVFGSHGNATLVDVVAYCLMPNHFHLLIREKAPGNISKFVQKVSTGYTMYFNKRYERTGVLFQGKFKATHVDNDRYLKHVVSYIHLNPIKLIEPEWKEKGIKNRRAAEKYLNEYRYSSYRDYGSESRPESVIISKKILLDYFELPVSFKESVRWWLDHSHE